MPSSEVFQVTIFIGIFFTENWKFLVKWDRASKKRRLLNSWKHVVDMAEQEFSKINNWLKPWNGKMVRKWKPSERTTHLFHPSFIFKKKKRNLEKNKTVFCVNKTFQWFCFHFSVADNVWCWHSPCYSTRPIRSLCVFSVCFGSLSVKFLVSSLWKNAICYTACRLSMFSFTLTFFHVKGEPNEKKKMKKSNTQ